MNTSHEDPLQTCLHCFLTAGLFTLECQWVLVASLCCNFFFVFFKEIIQWARPLKIQKDLISGFLSRVLTKFMSSGLQAPFWCSLAYWGGADCLKDWIQYVSKSSLDAIRLSTCLCNNIFWQNLYQLICLLMALHILLMPVKNCKIWEHDFFSWLFECGEVEVPWFGVFLLEKTSKDVPFFLWDAAEWCWKCQALCGPLMPTWWKQREILFALVHDLKNSRLRI